MDRSLGNDSCFRDRSVLHGCCASLAPKGNPSGLLWAPHGIPCVSHAWELQRDPKRIGIKSSRPHPQPYPPHPPMAILPPNMSFPTGMEKHFETLLGAFGECERSEIRCRDACTCDGCVLALQACGVCSCECFASSALVFVFVSDCYCDVFVYLLCSTYYDLF